MDRINQTLLTISEANRLAVAKNPHAHRLALILLDNLAEVTLRRRSESEFNFDQTSWINGVRKYNKKKRTQIRRFHNHLIDLSVEKDWITEQDAHILSFAHRLRNTTYHEGTSDDPIELEIGLTLLFRFLIKYLPKWRSSGLIMMSPQAPMSIEFAIDDQTGCAPLVIPASLAQYNVLSSGADKEAVWLANLQYCVTYAYDRDIRPAIKRRIENMLDDVADHIHLLTKYDDTDFNPVLAHRFTKCTPVFSQEETAGKKLNDPVIALNIYLAVLDQEEELLDIEDFATRATKFHQLLNAHSFTENVFNDVNLQHYYALAESVIMKSEFEGITIFLETERVLKKFATAAYECASDLDGYIMWMVDYYEENKPTKLQVAHRDN